MSAIFPAGKVCVAPAPHRISSIYCMMQALGVATIAGCRRHPPWWSKDGNLSEDLGPALNMGRCLTWDYDIVLLGERDAAPRMCVEWCCRVSSTSICCSLGTSMTFKHTFVLLVSCCLFYANLTLDDPNQARALGEREPVRFLRPAR